jgi:hypothetical protein
MESLESTPVAAGQVSDVGLAATGGYGSLMKQLAEQACKYCLSTADPAVSVGTAAEPL